MSEGIPYLGSKISLISKSEIRYEGILYTIDTNESTVALAKVRSFGTEDRPTDRPVAARDEVYDYIIFRGRDIKDIRVCEPPKPQLTLTGGLPNDPAIVQHSAPTSAIYQSPEYGKHGFGPVGGIPPYYPAGAVGLGQSQQFMAQQASASGSRSTTPTPVRKSPTIDQGVQVSGVSTTPKDEKKDKKSSPPPPHMLKQQLQPQSQRSNFQGGQQNKMPNRGRRYNQPNNIPNDKDAVNSLSWMPSSRRGRGMRGGRGSFAKPKDPALDGEFTKPKEPQLKFDNDYDFEQANAEFQEMENKLSKTKISEAVPNGDDKKDDSGNETAAGDPEEESVSYYDRNKSFFDNISCESSERSKGKFQRTDWRQERKLNVETFGVNNSFMRRGGYRGRGYRGRGGYRGGRGRGRGGMSHMNPGRGNDNRMPVQQNRQPSLENWVRKENCTQ